MSHLSHLALALFLCLSTIYAEAQTSVAHRWTDVHIEAVKLDFARPTVITRNLWQTSAAMYDAWAVYDETASPYLLGNTLGDYACSFDGVPEPADTVAAQEMAISYAAYRMMKHRYASAPNNATISNMLDSLMLNLGYNTSFTSVDYSNNGPAALGNYLAQEMIAAALLDNANEVNNYENQFYESVNEPLHIDQSNFMGNPDLDSLNRWQAMELSLFCDAGGNTFTFVVDFFSPEWGSVLPFALADSVKTVMTQNGQDWTVYHDPGAPPQIALDGGQESDAYRWNHEVVTDWSSFLDPEDPTSIDISPLSMGNIPIENLPIDQVDLEAFYNWDSGEVTGNGYAVNPQSGLPYSSQVVKRGDYTRAVAEFWADGSDGETPAGHWYSMYNEVSQHPSFTWMWQGEGEPLSELDYDIRSYFTLGGALHDAAIAAWGAKGYYDFIRPVSAIRAMAELGQSTDPLLPNYHPAGLELETDYIELIQLGDTVHISDTIRIAGPSDVGLLKIRCWAGPLSQDTCIAGAAPEYDTLFSGVGWKYAIDYWPYQQPTYVSPPYAGYVSGHAAFARAGAEILSLTTGDDFFPGGMAEFECEQDEFLVFETGPSETITLQWATYFDAAHQAGLSRILSGVNTPIDVLTGTKLGHEVASNAFTQAITYFVGTVPEVQSVILSDLLITDADEGSTFTVTVDYEQTMNTDEAPSIAANLGTATFSLTGSTWLSDSIYQASYLIIDEDEFYPNTTFNLQNGSSISGLIQSTPYVTEAIHLDMLNPAVDIMTPAAAVIDNSMIGVNGFSIDVVFDDIVDQDFTPFLSFPVEDPSASLVLNTATSDWTSENSYRFDYTVNESITTLELIDVELSNVFDTVGNPIQDPPIMDVFSIDIVSGVEDYVLGEGLQVYPNPVSIGQDIVIVLDDKMTVGTIQLLDAIGRIVNEWQGVAGTERVLRISTKRLDSGNYTLVYFNEELRVEHQVVIRD